MRPSLLTPTPTCSLSFSRTTGIAALETRPDDAARPPTRAHLLPLDLPHHQLGKVGEQVEQAGRDGAGPHVDDAEGA